MPSGRLVVRGKLDVSQFWPAGKSDADTYKVTVTPDSFLFQPTPRAPLRVTTVFNDAIVKGRGRKAVVEKGKLTVRANRADAAELHYLPVAVTSARQRSAAQSELWKQWSHEYRQPLGEGATVALRKKLNAIASGEIDCEVVSSLDQPNEACDTYGRLVGDLIIPRAGKLNVNMWLLESGWAFPTFYSAMTEDEITQASKVSAAARKANRGVWKYATNFSRAKDFDWALRFRGKGAAVDPEQDMGRVGRIMVPKLFRRLSTWAVNRRAKMIDSTFVDYLRKKPDELHLVSDFIEQGPSAAPVHRLDEMMSPAGKLLRPIEELVFREAPSTLYDSRGRRITSWF